MEITAQPNVLPRAPHDARSHRPGPGPLVPSRGRRHRAAHLAAARRGVDTETATERLGRVLDRWWRPRTPSATRTCRARCAVPRRAQRPARARTRRPRGGRGAQSRDGPCSARPPEAPTSAPRPARLRRTHGQRAGPDTRIALARSAPLSASSNDASLADDTRTGARRDRLARAYPGPHAAKSAFHKGAAQLLRSRSRTSVKIFWWRGHCRLPNRPGLYEREGAGRWAVHMQPPGRCTTQCRAVHRESPQKRGAVLVRAPTFGLSTKVATRNATCWSAACAYARGAKRQVLGWW